MKEAWDILRTVHEGTDTVKQIKTQNLTTAFKTLCMKELETFDDSHEKLSGIVN